MGKKNGLILELLKDHWDWFIFHYQVSTKSQLLYPSERISKLENLRYLDQFIKSVHELLKYKVANYPILNSKYFINYYLL